MTPDFLIQQIREMNPEALFAHDFDDALVGYTTSFLPHGGREAVAVYDKRGCIAILCGRDKMTLDDAEEYFDFNVDGAFVGQNGPVFVDFPCDQFPRRDICRH